MTLGEYILKIRNERGYSQRDLAGKSGISPAEISRVESGKHKTPSPAVLKAISDALVIHYDYLMQLAGYLKSNANAEESIMKSDSAPGRSMMQSRNCCRQPIRHAGNLMKKTGNFWSS